MNPHSAYIIFFDFRMTLHTVQIRRCRMSNDYGLPAGFVSVIDRKLIELRRVGVRALEVGV